MPKFPSSMKRRGQKREVVYDPEARKAYLRGFSERKRQRRAYGLAMQKVKDRKAKIEERAQLRKDELERVEQAEKQKEQLLAESIEANRAIGDVESDGESSTEIDVDQDAASKGKEQEHGGKILQTTTYNDKMSAAHWGGQVTVTTQVINMGNFESSDEEEDEKRSAKSKCIDLEQRNAGKVGKYLAQLKGNMPSKKNRDANHARRKGQNGASEGGVGGAGNLKIAQKVLTKAKAKQKGGNLKKKGKRSRR